MSTTAAARLSTLEVLRAILLIWVVPLRVTVVLVIHVTGTLLGLVVGTLTVVSVHPCSSRVS